MRANPTVVSTRTSIQQERPLWLTILAIFSWMLAAVTALPQFMYVLYAMHVITIGPHSNIVGQIWNWYSTTIQHQPVSVNSVSLAGAVEDAFVLGPLYFVTGVGLWFRRSWVIIIGLITASMIFYAILYFFLIYTFEHRSSAGAVVAFWITSLPYLLYPIWLGATVLLRRSLFTNKGFWPVR